MKQFWISLLSSCLMITTPLLSVPPLVSTGYLDIVHDVHPPSYDDILHLLERIEKEDLGALSAAEEREISHFLSLLAIEGSLPGDDLQKELLEFLEEAPTYRSAAHFISPKASTSFHQNLDTGLRQSYGIEIVKDGGSIAKIQPPSSTTQSRELSRNSSVKILMKQCTKSYAVIQIALRAEALPCKGWLKKNGNTSDILYKSIKQP